MAAETQSQSHLGQWELLIVDPFAGSFFNAKMLSHMYNHMEGDMTASGLIKANSAGTFMLGGIRPIHRLGFGAMRLTGPGIWGDPKSRKEAYAVLKRAIELGVNFIDTADSYGPEVSENIIAEALHPYPSDLIIATKGGLTRQGPDGWSPVGRPEYLIHCVEMSLRRLKLDCIDLYQFHAIDPLVRLEDSLGALKKMQQQGKIRMIGLSNFSISDIERAKKIISCVSIQNRYNLADRQSEDVLNHCEENRLAFIPWFPVGSGELTHGQSGLEKIAKEKEKTPAQIALAWLLKRSDAVIPIPGTSSITHLEENVAAAGVNLTEKDFEFLNASRT